MGFCDKVRGNIAAAGLGVDVRYRTERAPQVMRTFSFMHVAALLVGLVLLSACSTHPITGRDQILAVPAVQLAYAEVGFALSAGIQLIAPRPSCEPGCGAGERLASFAGRVAALGAQLQTCAREMSPELFERIDGFRIEVNDQPEVSTGSSAGGRIVLGSGLAGLEPTDTVIAFLIAREMAHVIARHAEENSGASIAVSALGMLLPGINMVARFVASRLGSNALQRSWAAEQRREADEIAISLVERSGLSLLNVALGLESGIKRARLPEGEWGARYLDSTRRVVLLAESKARYAALAY